MRSNLWVRYAALGSHGHLWCVLTAMGVVLAYGSATTARAQQHEPRDLSAQPGAVVRVEGNELLVRSPNDQQTHSYRVTDQTQITIDGRPAELKDLRPGDKLHIVTAEDDPQMAKMIKATREVQPQPQRRDRFQAPEDDRWSDARDRRRHFGLGILIVPRQDGREVKVAEVILGSPAERAGVRHGDTIISVNGARIRSALQLARAIRDFAGDRFDVQVRRGGEDRAVTIRLAERDRMLDDRQDQRRFGYRAEPNAWLGVRLGPADERGARIVRVYPGSPAARAGISSDDILLQIDDQRLVSPDDAAKLLDRFQPNDEVTLVLQRDDREQTRKVRLTDRANFFGRHLQAQEQRWSGSSDDEDEMFSDDDEIPEEAMMLEFHRHLCRQIQRLEMMMGELTEEVRSMRKQLDEIKTQRQFRPDQEQRSEDRPRGRRF